MPSGDGQKAGGEPSLFCKMRAFSYLYPHSFSTSGTQPQVTSDTNISTMTSMTLSSDISSGALSDSNSKNNSTSSRNAAAIRQRKRRRPLTNTNTDALCNNDSIWSKWIYRFNLWTGKYGDVCTMPTKIPTARV